MVQAGPYAIAEDAGDAITPSATSEPEAMTLPGADSGSQPTVAGDASLPIGEAGHGPTSPCDLSGRAR